VETTETLTIGQLAEAAGVHLETVRYYERRGLLAEPPRSPAGYRQYGSDELWRLRMIGRAKRLGFTLAEIGELLDGADGARASAGAAAPDADRVLAAARARIDAVDHAMRALADQRVRLEQLVGVCTDGPAADCSALRLMG
jgi:DNA-binding transcriptional MerR regulator